MIGVLKNRRLSARWRGKEYTRLKNQHGRRFGRTRVCGSFRKEVVWGRHLTRVVGGRWETGHLQLGLI